MTTICVAKLCAFREKDRNFVDALIADGLVDPEVIATRIKTVPERYHSNIERATAWLAHRRRVDEQHWARWVMPARDSRARL